MNKEFRDRISNFNFNEQQKQALWEVINFMIAEQISKANTVPVNGKDGQFLVADANGNPQWVDHTCYPIKENSTYGIRWTKGSKVCYRIGNMYLHQTCPIQNRLTGVLHEGKTILKYLNPDGWGLEASDGTIPVLDGSQGDVGVAMEQEYFCKVIDLGDVYELWISDYNLDGTWIRISPCIYSANKTLTRINDDGVEEAFNACIAADDETHIGGNKNATYASKLHGKPRTGINIVQMINTCKARNNGLEMIDSLHYYALMMLFFIEYANFNSQDAVNKELTSGGFKQGGLGVGITNLDGTKWNNYNAYNPIMHTNFQVEANIGNKSFCDTPIVLGTDYTDDNTTFNTIPAFYHGIHAFGDIFSFIADLLFINDPENTVKAKVYKVNRGVNLNDVTVNNIEENAVLIGYIDDKNGYIKEWDLSSGPYFIPADVSDKFKYDYNYAPSDKSYIRVLLVGGRAYSGSAAGFGYSYSYSSRSIADDNFGFLSMTLLD